MEQTAAPRRAARRRGRPVLRFIWDFIKGFFLVIFTLLVIGILSAGLFYRTFNHYVATVLEPEMDVDIKSLTLKQSSTVYYQDKASGAWVEMTKLHGSENRTIVTYDQIPDHVVKALIAVEDKRFYEHEGVDWLGTAGQIRNMLLGRDVRGASTITQQVIKNVTGNNQVTIRRKVLEIFQALRAHKNYSNEEILETYFNLVYYGDGAYGLEAAAETYFGKTVEQLDVAEGACIIGITQYPYMYDPSRGEKYRAANKERQEWVLKKMWEQEYLTEQEYEDAKAEKLVFVWDDDYVGENPENESETSSELDSFFVEQVYRDVVAALVEQGYDERVASQMVYNGGYQIYCTIDPEIQNYVEQVYANRGNFNYTAKSGQQLQSGMTVIDNATGNIVAIGGRVGERKGALEWSYATSTSQCGSAIKPLSVYAPAIDAGVLSAASVIDDYPVMELSGSAWPVNAYTGYRGLISIQDALRISSNTCAVRVLQMLTPAASYSFMVDKLGFSAQHIVTQDISAAGALALGGLTKGVSTMEMAAAYETFANNGIYVQPRTFIEVKDSKGNVVIDNTQDTWVAMKETTVYTVNELLKNVMRSGGTGTSAAFSGMTQAGKTGTTNSKKDRYFVGYTPYYTAAVWCGYDTPERINTNDNPSALVWKKVMEHIHQGLADKDFPTASNGMTRVTVCSKTGLLAGGSCGETRSVLVPEGSAPVLVCDAHVGIPYCAVSNMPAGQFCPRETLETHYAIDLTRPNTSKGFGYTRKLLYRGMSDDEYANYAIQVEAGLRDAMPGGAPITARDSGAVLTDIKTIGTCTWHLLDYVAPPSEADPETPAEPSVDPPVDPPAEPATEPPQEEPAQQPDDPGEDGAAEPAIEPNDEVPTDPEENTPTPEIDEQQYRDDLLNLDDWTRYYWHTPSPNAAAFGGGLFYFCASDHMLSPRGGGCMKRVSRPPRRRTSVAATGKREAPRRTAARAEIPRGQFRTVFCGATFVVLVALKLLLPEAMAGVRGTVGKWLVRDADFVSAFSAVGRAVSGEARALEDAYVAVFGAEDAMDKAREVSGESREVSDDAREVLGEAEVELPAATDYPEHTAVERHSFGFDYASPLNGVVTSPFGWRVHPGTGVEAFHYGVDIAADEGTDICAFADGVVGVVGESVELGKYLTVHHADGILTLYAHCSRVTAVSGGEVKCGDKVAEVGQTGNATGPHLHFEVREGEDWLDPQDYL